MSLNPTSLPLNTRLLHYFFTQPPFNVIDHRGLHSNQRVEIGQGSN